MSRSELDRLLEKTVADALGVALPEKPRRHRRTASAPQQKASADADRHLQPA